MKRSDFLKSLIVLPVTAKVLMDTTPTVTELPSWPYPQQLPDSFNPSSEFTFILDEAALPDDYDILELIHRAKKTGFVMYKDTGLIDITPRGSDF